MNRVDIRQTIDIYEIDGVDVALKDMKLGIHSHGNHPIFVDFEVRGHKYTVMGNALLIAINNAMNT